MATVDDTYSFSPPRRMGVIFQIGMIILLIGTSVWGLWQSTSANVGPLFLFYMLPAVLALLLVPVFGYRLYTLQSAIYTLERDYIRLQWGWRVEEIPTSTIIWVRPATDLEVSLKLPRIRWPGSILGSRRLPDGRPVEFLASQASNLVLIGTRERVYAISPVETERFIRSHRRLIELGSLNPSPPVSIYPSFLFARVWEAIPARTLIIIGILELLLLFIWASFAIPRIPQISLGFTPIGTPREPLPSIQLMLLPVLNLFAFLLNTTLGIFFYRRDENHPWAYLFWSTSVLVGGLFSLGFYFILFRG